MLSLENAAVERLHARIQECPLEHARLQMAHHLKETREQKERLRQLVLSLNGKPTEERAGLPSYSLPETLVDILRNSSTPREQELKSFEADMLIEDAEIIGYNTLIQIATKVDSEAGRDAIPALRQSLEEEERMRTRLRANMPSDFIQLWPAGEPEISFASATEA